MFEDISGMTREEILERIKDNGFFIANVNIDRTKPKIHVINLNTLMNNIYTNIRDFKVFNYDKETFEANFKDILNEQNISITNESGNTENINRLELILRYLQSIQTTIEYSAIKDYI